jgi:hypothetical protein
MEAARSIARATMDAGFDRETLDTVLASLGDFVAQRLPPETLRGMAASRDFVVTVAASPGLLAPQALELG